MTPIKSFNWSGRPPIAGIADKPARTTVGKRHRLLFLWRWFVSHWIIICRIPRVVQRADFKVGIRRRQLVAMNRVVFARASHIVLGRSRSSGEPIIHLTDTWC